jgi:hypothetical protein
MNKITLLASALAFAVASLPALAAPPNTFKDDHGIEWTVSGNPAGFSLLHMDPSASAACPQHRIKWVQVDPTKVGPPMTRQQKARGDQRGHLECDWSTEAQQAPPVPASIAPQQSAPPPAVVAPPPPMSGAPNRLTTPDNRQFLVNAVQRQ